MPTDTSHADTEILTRALSAIEGHDQLEAALAALAAHTQTLKPPTPDPREAILDDVRERLRAGKPIPDDLGDRLAEVDAADEARQGEASALGRTTPASGSGLAGRLRNERDQLVRSRIDDALAVVRNELDAVLGEVREIDRTLGAVASPEAAVEASGDAPAAWRRLTGLVDRYDHLRDAHSHAGELQDALRASWADRDARAAERERLAREARAEAVAAQLLVYTAQAGPVAPQRVEGITVPAASPSGCWLRQAGRAPRP